MPSSARWRAAAVVVRVALPIALTACGESKDEEPTPAPPRYDEPGAHPVGSRTFLLEDAARSRTLRVELWYPAAPAASSAAATGFDVAELAATPDERAAYATLLADAPGGCPTSRARAAREAALASGDSFPIIAFSHCMNCTRFSALTVAERLASHGFVVAAPDHAGNTLFDDLAGTSVDLDPDFLEIRAGDVEAVLDALLDPTSAAVPEALRGRLDPARVGVFGHSFGAATAGLVLSRDGRVAAGMAMAAPFSNPLLPGVDLAAISRPSAFLVAVEDNSITEIGNGILRDNFERVAPPAWKLEVADAGHWSFSDLCAITPSFQPGCGEDARQTDPTETFTYLPAGAGREVASVLTTAFFAWTLRGDAAAKDELERERVGVAVAAR
ncbi:MAG: dienelactone hydrolase family protein [Polyangiaceae bacterium]|nr:dienelactone hydrolase family protein [Polyangiaceae bacterium]